jgi:epoxyqueuosine reductase QueG
MRLENLWKEPLTGFADAEHPGFQSLKELVHPQHELPEDVLKGAKTVISYFIAFTETVTQGNALPGLSSEEWARAYEETNKLLTLLADHLVFYLNENGCRAAVSGQAAVFDRKEIVSRWSQRHIAYLAGLGTFGLNNMLITRSGCGGRFGSVITDLSVEPDRPVSEEYCLYKRNKSCGVCLRRCSAGALTEGLFDKKACYDQCLRNAGVYTRYGSSYASGTRGEIEATGSEVCGKCTVNLPCTHRIP